MLSKHGEQTAGAAVRSRQGPRRVYAPGAPREQGKGRAHTHTHRQIDTHIHTHTLTPCPSLILRRIFFSFLNFELHLEDFIWNCTDLVALANVVALDCSRACLSKPL